jgi:thiamine-monophosphate kinase
MPHAVGELDLIERIRAGWGGGAPSPTPRKPGTARGGIVLGIGDDCAILRPPRGHDLLVTTDFSLEGRHFRRDWHSPESAGHRALARGLSDLAAMGARPLAAFLSLALPPEMLKKKAGRMWLERFFTGLQNLAGQATAPLAGGDTSESPSGLILADIVLVGSAPAGRALRRSGGRSGDALYVSGSLGGAAAELKKVTSRKLRSKASTSTPGAHPQMFPEPRLALGQALLRRRLATSAIDLSDGLSTDLHHLCRESGVGAIVEADALPIHPLAADHHAEAEALDLALNGGEDYELLFSAHASVRIPNRIAGVRVTRIGRLVEERTISLLGRDQLVHPLKPGGWEHFAVKQ